MLSSLIPPRLHRIALRWAYRLRHRWRRMVRAQLEGVVVLVTDLEGRLLMVRHSYGPQGWALPGGGVNRGEGPEDTARREVAEEVGCALEGVRVLERLEEVISDSPHVSWVLTATTLDRPRPDGREILEARFFPTHSLPEPMTRLARARIDAWRGKLR